MAEERMWIEQIKAGKMEFFPPLYERYHRRLHALCYRFTGNSHDAEDQLQEVFMHLLKRIDQFAGKSSFSTWVYRVATNYLLNYVRSQKPIQQATQPLDDVEPSAQGDPHLKLALRQAIAELPTKYRIVLVLHDQEGLKHDEIAEILEITASTARAQLCRARTMLRESLKSHQPED